MGIVTDVTVEGVAAAIERGARMPEPEHREMRANAQLFATSHSWRDLARAVERWYRESLE